MFRHVLIALMLAPAALAGTAEYPEWRDDLLDTSVAPYPFLDVTAGWIEVWDDDTFYVNLEVAIVPPAPGIGAANTGLMYSFYHHYVVYDQAGVRPFYENCPVDGGFLTSWVDAGWWGANGPQDDPTWSFHYGCKEINGMQITYYTQGEVKGSIDLVTRVITWIVPRGLPQTLVPSGCHAEQWTLQKLHGEAVWWATVAVLGIRPNPTPLVDVGPNQGYGRPFEFPECDDDDQLVGRISDSYDVTFDGEVAEKRLTFKEAFNGTLRYLWPTESENVTISWDADVIEGAMFMTVYDAEEQIVDIFVDEDVTDSYTVRGAMPGNWTIELDFDFYMREFGFELIDAEQYESERSEPIGGESEPVSETETPEEDSPQESNAVAIEASNQLQNSAKESPGFMVAPLLLGLLFLAKRRN